MNMVLEQICLQWRLQQRLFGSLFENLNFNFLLVFNLLLLRSRDAFYFLFINPIL